MSDGDNDEIRWQAHHRIEFEIASDNSTTDERPFGRNGNDSGSSTNGSSDLEVGPDRYHTSSPCDRCIPSR